MKYVYIVVGQFTSTLERAFKSKKDAISFIKELGYSSCRNGFYHIPKNKDWSSNNDFFTIERLKVF